MTICSVRVHAECENVKRFDTYTGDYPEAFADGHLMVQVQSSWFPLYDRNPQTFVPNIMTAPLESYRLQKHRVHHSAAHATHLELLVDPAAR